MVPFSCAAQKEKGGSRRAAPHPTHPGRSLTPLIRPAPLHSVVITGESDSRESQPRGGITHLTVDIPSARRAQGETHPSRWRTPEFMLYYAIFTTAVLWMIYVPIQLSSSAYTFAVFSWACRPYPSRLFLPPPGTHPNYDLYRHRLAGGWLPGTQIVSFAS